MKKSDLKEIIREEIALNRNTSNSKNSLKEGFFDRLKANIKGVNADNIVTFDNLTAFVKGDKDSIKDPKLIKNMTILQSKAKTLDDKLKSAMKDMSILFPKEVLANTPENFQTLLDQYFKLLEKTQTLNTQISTGEYKAPSGVSTPSSGTSQPSQDKKGPARDEKGRFTKKQDANTGDKKNEKEKVEGSVNLAPIAKTLGIDPSKLNTVITSVKKGDALNPAQNKILADLVTNLIKTENDKLIQDFAVQVKKFKIK